MSWPVGVAKYRVAVQHKINTRKQVAHAPCSQLDLSLVQHVLHLRSDHQYAPSVVLKVNCGGKKIENMNEKIGVTTPRLPTEGALECTFQKALDLQI